MVAENKDGSMTISMLLDGSGTPDDEVASSLTSSDMSSDVSSGSSDSSESSLSSTGTSSVSSGPVVARPRVEVVVVPPVMPGGVVVVTVPRTYTPPQFDKIRESVLTAVEDSGANVVFLPEGVVLASLSPEELWRMGLGVINRGQADEAEPPEEDDGTLT